MPSPIESMSAGRLLTAALGAGLVALNVEVIVIPLLIVARVSFVIPGILFLGGITGFVAGGVAAGIARRECFWAAAGAWGFWGLVVSLTLPYIGAEVDWSTLLTLKLLLGLVAAIIGHRMVAMRIA